MDFMPRQYRRLCVALLIVTFLSGLSRINGQEKQSILGEVIDLQDKSPLSYATVALLTTPDSALIAGTISNEEGQFVISPVPKGHYYLRVSFIGYQSETQILNLSNGTNYNTGKISLKQEAINMEEALVTAERIKAKTTEGKTIFFVNKQMNSVSNSGVDILKHLPGIQVDLMQNITLEGSKDIIILVNGKERDLNYISQINAKQIDNIEVISPPGPKYDAHISGVLNIILKERESGVSGHVYAEIPTSKSEIFLNPSYSLNYRINKFNVYTSYNGELKYFDIIEKNIRELNGPSGFRTYHSFGDMRQKTWKHRFHVGVDFFMNPTNQFNFYSFFNPYSQELDGTITMESKLNEIKKDSEQVIRAETDKNYQANYSLYYKHLFDQKGQEISFDINYYNLKADNTQRYAYHKSFRPNSSDVINCTKPRQHSARLQLDFTSPLNQNIRLDAGMKSRFNSMKDKNSRLFDYQENIHAAYVALSISYAHITLSSGLRAENSAIKQGSGKKNEVFALLPNAQVNLQINKKQKLQLDYRRSIHRPNIYQLNPALSVIDPYTIQRGNPDLKPAFRHQVSFDYILLPGNNYLSTKIFYSQTRNSILNLSYINDSELLETRTENLGNMQQYGVQWTGALKLSKTIGFSPYLKLFRRQATPNDLANPYNISTTKQWACESGFSATVNFKNDLAVSILFQHSSSNSDLQNTRYSDALYFLSLDKTFNKRVNIGISTTLPFARTFTYSGIETEGENFYSLTEGDINISTFPFGMHVRYQFNQGKKVNKIKREKRNTENIRSKGF